MILDSLRKRKIRKELSKLLDRRVIKNRQKIIKLEQEVNDLKEEISQMKQGHYLRG